MMFVLYTGLLIAASLINLILIVYAYLHRGNKAGSKLYMAVVLCSVFYAVGYAFEIMSKSLEMVLFWLKVEYIGIALFPALWLLLVFVYIGKKRVFRWTLMAGLFMVPAITLITHYTNGVHHLFYQHIQIHHSIGLTIAETEKGPFYWLNIIYMYVALFYGNILLLVRYQQVAVRYKRQVLALLIGSCMPFLGDFLYRAGFSPENIDLSPFMIALSTPIYGWSLFRLQLLDLVPIARDKIFESIGEGVIVIDEHNRIVDYNPAAQAIFSELSGHVLGKELDIIALHPKLFTEAMEEFTEFEIDMKNEEETRYYNARISPIMDRRSRIIGRTIVLNDITENVSLLEKLKHLAMIDEITQIYNWRRFIEKSQAEFENARQEGQAAAMIFFDVDHFKNINDVYGHAAGDAVLYTIAQRCKELLCDKATFGRYGGEEFCICVINSTLEAVRETAEQVRQAIAQTPVSFDNEMIFVTASFGISAKRSADTTTLNQLLKEADQAMYSAKAAGRNQVITYQ